MRCVTGGKKGRKTLKKEGVLKAFKRLISAPTKSRTFKRDRNWIRRTFMKS